MTRLLLLLVINFMIIPFTAGSETKFSESIVLQSGHTEPIFSVGISADAKKVITGGKDYRVLVWDAITGNVVHRIDLYKKGYTPSGYGMTVRISPDGRYFAAAAADQDPIKIWEYATGNLIQTVNERSQGSKSFCFSADSKYLAFAADDKTIRLTDLATGREIRKLQGHRKVVIEMAMSADGKYLASGDTEDTVLLWQVANGKKRRFKGHTRAIWSLAFSPDSKLIASSDPDKTIRIWGVSQWGKSPQKEIRTPEGVAYSVLFSPDSKYILSGGKDRTITFREVATGNIVRTLSGHTGRINSLKLSPDQNYLLSGSDDQTAILWDMTSGKLVRRFGNLHKTDLQVKLSVDANFVITKDENSDIRFWEIATGKKIWEKKARLPGVMAMAFSPDGKWVATGDGNGTVILWNAEIGKRARFLRGHKSTIHSLAFSPDSHSVISVDERNFVRVWEIETGKLMMSSKAHHEKKWPRNSVSHALSQGGSVVATGELRSVSLWKTDTGDHLTTIKIPRMYPHTMAFSSDGKRIAIGSHEKDTPIQIWNTETGELYQSYQHTGNTAALAFSPQGDFIAVNSNRQTSVREIASGNPIWTSDKQTLPTMFLRYSADGSRLISGFLDGNIVIWDVNRKEVVESRKGPYEPARNFSLSPDENRVVISGIDGSLLLHDLKTGKSIWTFKGHDLDFYSPLRFSPDGNILAFGTNMGSVVLYDLLNGEEIRQFAGHRYGTFALAFTRAGDQLASGGHDKAIKLWDIRTGNLIRTFTGHDNQISSVAFSPDETYLISTGTEDKTVRVWEVATGKQLMVYQGHDSSTKTAVPSPDGTLVLSGGSYYDDVRLWEMKTGRQRPLKGSWFGDYFALGFSGDGKRILSGIKKLTIRNIATGEVIQDSGYQKAEIISVLFSRNEDYVLSERSDATVNVWKTGEDAPVLTLKGFKNGEWIAYTPKNEYVSSANAYDQVRFTSGGRSYPLNRFEKKYKRPERITNMLAEFDRQKQPSLNIEALRSERAAVSRTVLVKEQPNEPNFQLTIHSPHIASSTEAFDFSLVYQGTEYTGTFTKETGISLYVPLDKEVIKGTLLLPGRGNRFIPFPINVHRFSDPNVPGPIMAFFFKTFDEPHVMGQQYLLEYDNQTIIGTIDKHLSLLHLIPLHTKTVKIWIPHFRYDWEIDPFP